MRSIAVRPVQLDMMEFLVANAAGRVGHPPLIALQALTPLEPRAQHTVRLCVDQVVPATSTLPLVPRQSLSGGEVAATFEPSDFGLNTVSTAKLASVEGDRAAAFYFAVRIEDQVDGERVVVVVNGSGALTLRGGSLYPVRWRREKRRPGAGGCWSWACSLTAWCRRAVTAAALVTHHEARRGAGRPGAASSRPWGGLPEP